MDLKICRSENWEFEPFLENFDGVINRLRDQFSKCRVLNLFIHLCKATVKKISLFAFTEQKLSNF